LLNVSVKDCSAKVAVTDCAAFTVTVQVLTVPVQPPLQPVKVEPAAGVAVKVTAGPIVKGGGQGAPPENPVGAPGTGGVAGEPRVLVRGRGKDGGGRLAGTEGAACTVRVQVLAVPVQPPLQPVKVEPAAGVAVNVTAVPIVKDVEQVVPQEIPVGALVTV